MNNELVRDFILDAKDDNRILYSPNFYGKYKSIIKKIYEDVQKFDMFTIDGEFEDILIKVINDFEFDGYQNHYQQILHLLHLEFNKLVVPIIILVPLNNLLINLNNNDCFNLMENIKIFNPVNIEYDEYDGWFKTLKQKKQKNDAISEYFEQNAYAKLLKEHIVMTKDRYFFNNPIMTILIKNIPFKVEQEASRITEAVYSFIRMFDFEHEKDNNQLLRNTNKFAYTYSVYYNLPNTSPKPPYDNGYGYSYIFKFDPILDVNSNNFVKERINIGHLINKFVNNSFINRTKFTEIELKKMDKWQNAVLLYNSAYELASKEKYDVSEITLLTILESLFLKNTGNKKLLLANQVSDFLMTKNSKYSKQEIENTIKETYSHRSKFVHEGIVYNISQVKRIYDYQGVISGMKPFAYNRVKHSHEAQMIYKLFEIVGFVIKNY